MPFEGDTASLTFSKIAFVLIRRPRGGQGRRWNGATADGVPKKALVPEAMVAAPGRPQDGNMAKITDKKTVQKSQGKIASRARCTCALTLDRLGQPQDSTLEVLALSTSKG